MDLTFNVPINNLSFGSVSIALLREAYKRKLEPCVFPIGNLDLSAQREDREFTEWLIKCINKSFKNHKKSNPCLKLWHLNGGLESVSTKQVLLSFYECDAPTAEELNIVKNNHKVIFTNDYTVNTFKEYGCENVVKIPLGFDSFNFKVVPSKPLPDERITFNLIGKFEKRKNHAKVIKAWLKKFGNDPKYFLNCAIWNNFINPDQQKQIFLSLLEGKQWGNIQFLGFMPTNAMYNDFTCAGNVVIGMSGGEGFGLGEFQSLALGLHGVILNAHAYKEYANNENAVLVKPGAKEDCYDGMFFHPNQPFNQGKFWGWEEDDFIAGCEQVVKRVQENKINKKGLDLQAKFNYSDIFDKIVKELEN